MKWNNEITYITPFEFRKQFFVSKQHFVGCDEHIEFLQVATISGVVRLIVPPFVVSNNFARSRRTVINKNVHFGPILKLSLPVRKRWERRNDQKRATITLCTMQIFANRNGLNSFAYKQQRLYVNNPKQNDTKQSFFKKMRCMQTTTKNEQKQQQKETNNNNKKKRTTTTNNEINESLKQNYQGPFRLPKLSFVVDTNKSEANWSLLVDMSAIYVRS